MSRATVELKIMFIKLERVLFLRENMERNVRVRYVYILQFPDTDILIIIIHD